MPAFKPDVLVLVLGGLGSSEMVSINYNSVVALPKAQADLDAIARVGKWQVKDAKGETKSSGGPKPVPTTSITFRAAGVVGYNNGTLPIEPFISGLKQYKHIEIAYLVPSSFQFHGLKDFENGYVKIQMYPATNSYRYRVRVKDAGFSKLDLPLVQPERSRMAGEGMPLWLRILMAVALAGLGAAIVYFAAVHMGKRRTA